MQPQPEAPIRQTLYATVHLKRATFRLLESLMQPRESFDTLLRRLLEELGHTLQEEP
jgi:hypothetical protein